MTTAPPELKKAADAVVRCLDTTDLFAFGRAIDLSPDSAARRAEKDLRIQQGRYLRMTAVLTGRIITPVMDTSVLVQGATQAKALTDRLECAVVRLKRDLHIRSQKQTMMEHLSPGIDIMNRFERWIHRSDSDKQMASIVWADTIASLELNQIRTRAKTLAGLIAADPTENTEIAPICEDAHHATSESCDASDAKTAKPTDAGGDIPPLDTDSGDWVSNKTAADLEGVATRTLADYRQKGPVFEDGLCGRDKDKRVWRKVNGKSHPWYLKRSLKKYRR